MKHLLLLLLTLNLTLSFSQPKIGKEIVNTSTIYTIDESWEPKGATRFKADETNTYIECICNVRKNKR